MAQFVKHLTLLELPFLECASLRSLLNPFGLTLLHRKSLDGLRDPPVVKMNHLFLGQLAAIPLEKHARPEAPVLAVEPPFV